MLQNEYFSAAPAFFATEEPGRNHPGVVDHQEVAGQEQLREIDKIPVCHRPGRTVHNHEARLVPLRGRDLGDQSLRQVVIIVFNVEHRQKAPKKNAYRIQLIMSKLFAGPVFALIYASIRAKF
jgi:hypothetical protein